MKFTDCVPGRVVATPRGELLEVRSVKYNRMRARVLFPLQPRTTFREYGQDMVALMSEPKESLLAKYEQAIARRRR